MLGKWKQIQNPEIFQGSLQKTKYFEGWYFKFVSKDEKIAFAVIPGISLEDKKTRHAFIQVLDGRASKSYYYEFPISEFQYSKDKLDLRIGGNRFTTEFVSLDLPVLKGRIKIMEPHYFPKSIRSPGVMGWYAYMPFMQCYHGVVSTYHKLSGEIKLNQELYTLNGGVGYIEKDWGRSFPKCWIWAHSNHFKGNQVSLMASVAHIPWLGSFFIGFLVVLEIDGIMYRFATYTGAKMKAAINNDVVDMAFKSQNLILKVKAIPGVGAILKSPISGKMTGKVNESLQAEIGLELTRDTKVVYKGKGTSAGLEVAGDTDILLTQKWR